MKLSRSKRRLVYPRRRGGRAVFVYLLVNVCSMICLFWPTTDPVNGYVLSIYILLLRIDDTGPSVLSEWTYFTSIDDGRPSILE